jgi:hypothetical protein
MLGDISSITELFFLGAITFLLLGEIGAMFQPSHRTLLKNLYEMEQRLHDRLLTIEEKLMHLSAGDRSKPPDAT